MYAKLTASKCAAALHAPRTRSCKNKHEGDVESSRKCKTGLGEFTLSMPASRMRRYFQLSQDVALHTAHIDIHGLEGR